MNWSEIHFFHPLNGHLNKPPMAKACNAYNYQFFTERACAQRFAPLLHDLNQIL